MRNRPEQSTGCTTGGATRRAGVRELGRRHLSAVIGASMALLLLVSPAREARALETLDRSQTSVGGLAVFGLFSPWGTITAAQPFTAGLTGSLTKVDLYVGTSSGSGPFQVAIMAADGSGNPTGPALGGGTYWGSVSGGWVTVSLDSPAAVSAGTTYAIVLTSDTGTFRISGGDLGSGGFAAGRQYYSWLGYWDLNGLVYAFQTYVDVPNTYSWSGFLPPINSDGTSVFRVGSTVPVKFALTSTSAGITNAVVNFAYKALDSNPEGTINEGESTSAATTGSLFRYDASTGQYTFNWGTKGLTAGTYELRITLNDGTTHTVNVNLKGK